MKKQKVNNNLFIIMDILNLVDTNFHYVSHIGTSSLALQNNKDYTYMFMAYLWQMVHWNEMP